MFQKGWGLVTVPCRDLEGSFVCRFTNKLDFRNDPKKYVAARRDCKGDNGRLAEAPTDLRLYNISSAAVEDFGATSGEYFWIGAKNRCKGDGAVWGDTDRIVDNLSDDADCYECLAVKAGASDAGSVEYMYEDCRESLKYMCEGTFDETAIFPPVLSPVLGTQVSTAAPTTAAPTTAAPTTAAPTAAPTTATTAAPTTAPTTAAPTAAPTAPTTECLSDSTYVDSLMTCANIFKYFGCGDSVDDYIDDYIGDYDVVTCECCSCANTNECL